MNQLSWKIEGTLLRMWDAVYLLPFRLARIVGHIYTGLFFWRKKRLAFLPISKPGLWWTELSFYLLDVFAVAEAYETLSDWLKWNTRALTKKEKEIAKSVFGDTIDFRRVRVDESARIACQNWSILYVGFFTINSWGKFGTDILVHELMHVWQYQKYGSVYIPHALLAQRTPQGYDYGGVGALKKSVLNGTSLHDFNFEQQADIISDGYRLRQGLVPKWTPNDAVSLPVFEKYLKELQAKKYKGLPTYFRMFAAKSE